MKRIVSGLLAAVMCGAMLSGCGGQDKPTLRVYNWGDYIGEGVIEKFEEQYGVNVSYEVYDQNEDLYTKLKSTGSSYDVIIPSDYMISRMINEDMLDTINKDNIPNLNLIDESFKNMSFDPDNNYSVPYMWGTIGIIYNKTMVDEPVDSWNILWNEKYAGKIFMNDSVRDSIGVTLMSLGYSPNTKNMDEIEQAKQKLIDQKPLILAYVGDEVKDKMIAGEAAFAVVYSGDAMNMIDANPDLDYVVPKEGSNVWFDGMCIPKNAQNKELGEKFINFMCSTEIAEINREYICYASPQKEVVANLPEELKNDVRAYPDEETLKRCKVYEDLGEMTSVYDEVWSAVKAA